MSSSTEAVGAEAEKEGAATAMANENANTDNTTGEQTQNPSAFDVTGTTQPEPAQSESVSVPVEAAAAASKGNNEQERAPHEPQQAEQQPQPQQQTQQQTQQVTNQDQDLMQPPQQQKQQQQLSNSNSNSHSNETQSRQQEEQQPPPPTQQEQNASDSNEEVFPEQIIGQQRNVLVERYAPYIAPSDRSLADARQRLQTALHQTRQLRSAFTERVYGKYRVCLKPPATAQEIIDHIRNDPQSSKQTLETEIAQIKQEKELEKRHAQKLNQEISATTNIGSTLNVNADNAEQLMYISAGLSLVILPEDSDIDFKMVEHYPDRAPIHPETRQRVRAISQAAAAAGEVILERTRKGAAMRQEWLRQRQQQQPTQEQQQQQQQDDMSPSMDLLSSTSNATAAAATTTTTTTTNVVPSTLDSRLIQARSSSASSSNVPFTTPNASTAQGAASSPRDTTATATAAAAPFLSAPSELVARTTNKAATTAVTSHKKKGLALGGLQSGFQKQTTTTNTTVSGGHGVGTPRGGAGAATAPATGGAKGTRSTPAGIPVNISLSLHPTADELLESNHNHNNHNNITNEQQPVNHKKGNKKRHRASTAALMTLSSQGGGAAATASATRASPQQRLRHPHPESMGGRQRAANHNNPTWAKKELSTLLLVGNHHHQNNNNNNNNNSSGAPQHQHQHPQLQLQSSSYLNLALPPLPTPTERRRRKPLPVFENADLDHPSCTTCNYSTARAKSAIQSVLSQFQPQQKNNHHTTSQQQQQQEEHEQQQQAPVMTKISLLHGVQQDKDNNGDSSATKVSSEQQQQQRERPIDPTLAFSVLQAIGLITEKTDRNNNSNDRKRKFPSTLQSQMEHLKAGNENNLSSFTALHATWDKLNSSSNKRLRKFSDALLVGHNHNSKESTRTAKGETTSPPPPSGVEAEQQRAMSSKSPELATIRGGGEYLSETNDNNNNDASTAAGLSDNAEAHKTSPGRGDRRVPNINNNNNQQQQQQLHWEDPARAGMNNSYLGPSHSQAMPSNNPTGIPHHYEYQGHHHPSAADNNNYHHHQSQFNAFQFAQQLRHATNAMNHMPGDMNMGVSNYMGRFNNNSAAQWNMGGNSAAAMAAAQTSLAALGLSCPIGMYGNVQDRATRDLMAREQQNAAAARAVAAHQQSRSHNAFLGGAANPGFSPPSSSMHQQRPGHSHNMVNNSAAPSSSYASSPMMDPVATHASQQGHEHRSNHKLTPAPSQENPKQAHAQQQPKKRDEQPKKPNYEHVSINREVGDSQKTSLLNTTTDGRTAETRLQSSEHEPEQVAVTTVDDSGASPAPAPSPIKFPAGENKEGGMHFYLPKTPQSLSSNEAQLIQKGRFHEVVEKKSEAGQQPNAPALLEYLVAVGTAVPIPKTFVLNCLKERLNIPGFKNLANSSGFTVPREVIVAVILVWLWNHHEGDFQRAFAKNGRIDVDQTCKWLVQASVDASVRALTLYIANSGVLRGSRSSKPDSEDKERLSDIPPNLDLVSASVVAKALTTESCLNDEVDYVLPQFHSLVQYLDQCRVCALQLRSQERVLLACLISLKSVMSESFAHAYVSSMVRAGDALGHDRLGDIVLDDELKISSMLPYDIYKDEQGAWEDPCRPEEGFTPNLAGDVLTKTAHARAMIQKSLRRLQDRNNIKGGTPNSGAYADLSTGQSSAAAAGSAASVSSARSASGTGGGTPRDRSWNKRKVSTFSEVPCPPGSGSAQATSWALYDPKHFSLPLVWNPNDAANTPYGKHPGERQRAMSMSHQYGQHDSNPQDAKKQKRSMSFSTKTSDHSDIANAKQHNLVRSTHEIDWWDVAGYFNRVKLPGSLSPSHSQSNNSNSNSATAAAAANVIALKTIVSPFCRKVDKTPEPSDEEESDEEEDLSDEAILARHQVVLDEMKEKLTAFMEARKKQQERRKKKEKTF